MVSFSFFFEGRRFFRECRDVSSDIEIYLINHNQNISAEESVLTEELQLTNFRSNVTERFCLASIRNFNQGSYSGSTGFVPVSLPNSTSESQRATLSVKPLENLK